MRKSKFFLVVLFMVASLLSFAKPVKVKVIGNIKGLDECQVQFLDANSKTVLASTIAEKGFFEVNISIDDQKDVSVFFKVPSLERELAGKKKGVPLYRFFLGDSIIKLTGKLKKGDIVNFVAHSKMNDQVYKVYESSPNGKLKEQKGKEKNDLFRAINARMRNFIKDYQKKNKNAEYLEARTALEGDSKYKNLFKKVKEITEKLMDYEYQELMDFVSQISSETNKGLNAILYLNCKKLKAKYLKSIIDRYKSLQTEEQINNDYYVKELFDIYLEKNMVNKGADVFDKFIFKDANGQEVRLSDYKGQYIYLNFYNPEYISSIIELDQVYKTAEKYKNEDILFLHINLGEDYDYFKKFCKTNQLTRNHININDKYFYKTFKLRQLPRGILIDKNFKIYNFFVGKLYGDFDKEKRCNKFNGKTIEDYLKEIF